MKGQHRGYDRMAIELDHNGTGFQHTGATTTVFVVWLPHKSTMAVFGFLNVMMLVEAYSDWQRHGAILRCHPATPIGSYLQGWKAVAYAASLAAPLLIALKALYTMITRVHRPNFVFQLCFEGMRWAGAMYGLHYAREALVASVRQAC